MQLFYTFRCNSIHNFMLQQAKVQNIFTDVQVPTCKAIVRGEAEGDLVCQVGICNEGENLLQGSEGKHFMELVRTPPEKGHFSFTEQ